MNEREATEYVAALVDTVPDTPAPLIELLELGDRAHRRRKAHMATAVAAAAVVIIAVIATATFGWRANDPGPAIGSTGTVPDPEGAAHVVMAWLTTIQDDGPKAACRFMTPEFQQEMIAFNCNNPNITGSPPYTIGDVRLAETRLVAQDGDEVTIEVAFPGTAQLPRTTYVASYDHGEDRWLVAGHEPSRPGDTNLSGTWTVKALVGPDGESVLVESGRALPRLTFEDGQMNGSTGGCNSVFGTYVVGGDQARDLSFPRNQLGSTLVGCEEAPLVDRLLDVRHVSGAEGVRYLHAENWMIIAELRAR